MKRLATRASLQGATIHTPKELYDWAMKNCNTNVRFVSSEICSEEKQILFHRFASAASIPGIRSIHAAAPSGIDTIIMKTVSGATTGSAFRVVATKRAKQVDSNNNGKKSSRSASLEKKNK